MAVVPLQTNERHGPGVRDCEEEEELFAMVIIMVVFKMPNLALSRAATSEVGGQILLTMFLQNAEPW